MSDSNFGLDRGATASTYITWKANEQRIDGADGEVDLTSKFYVDPGRLKTGWGKLQKGMSPEWFWDKTANILEANPGKNTEEQQLYKPAISIEIFTQKEGYLLWTTNAVGASNGISGILRDCYEQKDQNPGKVAGFKQKVDENGKPMVERKSFKIGSTTVPLFEFVEWRDRPEGFVSPLPEGDIIENAPQSEEEIPF